MKNIDKEILNIFQDEIQVPRWVASEENSESFNNFLIIIFNNWTSNFFQQNQTYFF